jgi:hypothetical protein
MNWLAMPYRLGAFGVCEHKDGRGAVDFLAPLRA